jgi:hypothetical protein
MIEVLKYRLPTRIEKAVAVDVIGGPEFQTRIYPSVSGYEERQVERDRAVRRWTIDLVLLNLKHSEVRQLESVFRVCRGQAGAFLFKGPGEDHICRDLVTIDGKSYERHRITDLDGVNHDYFTPLLHIIPGTISGSYCEYLTAVRFGTDYWARKSQTTTLGGIDSIELVEHLEDHP